MESTPESPTLPDLLAPGLEIVFVGINPSLKSAQVGHYYAGPGNLFWRCLHESGLTPERLLPAQDRELLEYGIGITDCVKRPSRSAGEVSPVEFRTARPALEEKLARYQPRLLCFNGLMGYRGTFDAGAQLGLQPERLAGALVFVVPSTSAANAGFTREERVEWFRKLRELRDRVRETDSGSELGSSDSMKSDGDESTFGEGDGRPRNSRTLR